MGIPFMCHTGLSYDRDLRGNDLTLPRTRLPATTGYIRAIHRYHRDAITLSLFYNSASDHRDFCRVIIARCREPPRDASGRVTDESSSTVFP